MIVTFKDTITGATAKSDYPFSIWWWSEGNGACDCNRGNQFDSDLDHPCNGSVYRYIATDVEDHPDKSVDEQLAEVNEDLHEEYHLKTKDDILNTINQGLY